MRKKLKGEVSAIHIITIIAIAALLIGSFAFQRGTKDTVRATVTDKVVKRYDDTDKYLIFTDSETFEITDTIAYGNFRSSDVYGKIKVGETYDFTVCGWRIGFTSSYRNIVEVQEVG